MFETIYVNILRMFKTFSNISKENAKYFGYTKIKKKAY